MCVWPASTDIFCGQVGSEDTDADMLSAHGSWEEIGGSQTFLNLFEVLKCFSIPVANVGIASSQQMSNAA